MLSASTLDHIDLVIAILALAVAVYGIYYTRKCNRRKIAISNGDLFATEDNPPIAWFTIHNISPIPITVIKIEFFAPDGNVVTPLLDYEPVQTYSEYYGAFGVANQVPDAIEDYQQAETLDSPYILQPYSELELGYYFQEKHGVLSVKVTCLENIRLLKNYQSFTVRFADVDD